MSVELSRESLTAADSAVEQVLDECRDEAQRTRQAWIDGGQDTSLALVDVAADVVRRLVTVYGLEVD